MASMLSSCSKKDDGQTQHYPVTCPLVVNDVVKKSTLKADDPWAGVYNSKEVIKRAVFIQYVFNKEVKTIKLSDNWKDTIAKKINIPTPYVLTEGRGLGELVKSRHILLIGNASDTIAWVDNVNMNTFQKVLETQILEPIDIPIESHCDQYLIFMPISGKQYRGLIDYH